ncbi:MAG: DedA family protein [Proteobacteria bacterium]|nr:DedA family protein [Pseudomonadota bacterium]
MAGYLGLFATALLAATLIPVSSEAVLAALSVADGAELVLLVAVASLGNTLGAVVNWVLGRYCLHWQDRRWFPVSAATLARASDRFRRFGSWSLLFAWLPVIGDPLTFVAGILRVNFWVFVILTGTGKTARYAVIAVFADRIFG